MKKKASDISHIYGKKNLYITKYKENNIFHFSEELSSFLSKKSIKKNDLLTSIEEAKKSGTSKFSVSSKDSTFHFILITVENKEIDGEVCLLSDVTEFFNELESSNKTNIELEKNLSSKNWDLIELNEELSKKEATLRQIEDFILVGFWEYDTKSDTVSIAGKISENIKLKQLLSLKETLGLLQDNNRFAILRSILFSAKHNTNTSFNLKIKSDTVVEYFQINARAYSDEYGIYRVNGSILNITDRIHASERERDSERLLIQQSKMAAMGEMISAIAHQWKQPINVLSINLQQIDMEIEEMGIEEGLIKNSIDSALKQVFYMSKTIEDFRNFFAPNKIKKTFNLYESIKQVLDLVGAQLKAHGIHIKLRNIDPEASCYGIQSEIQQVFVNIINNAKDAIVENIANIKDMEGKITIDISAKHKNSIVVFSDNGGGIKKEILAKLFTPYTTSKGDKGTGIGLNISKMIVHKNGGEISAKNIENGAEFTISLPNKIIG